MRAVSGSMCCLAVNISISVKILVSNSTKRWINLLFIFSSPEPLGSQRELIVYQWIRRPSVVHHFQRSSPKSLGLSKPNFMWSLLERGNES